MVVLVLVGMTSSASADRGIWKSVFVGSMTLAAGGGYLMWNGVTSYREAESTLCGGGRFDESCSRNTTLTHTQYRALDEQLDRGVMNVNIGALGVVVGVGLGAYAFYKGFVQDDEREPSVVVAPAISPNGGGATMQLRW